MKTFFKHILSMFLCVMSFFGPVNAASDLLLIKTSMQHIILQAETGCPVKKAALEAVKNQTMQFFDKHAHTQVVTQFLIEYQSFSNFEAELSSLYTNEGLQKKIGAHHMRRLGHKAKAIVDDLNAYIIDLESREGLYKIDPATIDILKQFKAVCLRLQEDFFKQEYFLPATTFEILKDLLLHRPYEFANNNKLITAAVALGLWEFIGKKLDPEHEYTYSRPLSSATNMVSELWTGGENKADNAGLGDESDSDNNNGEDKYGEAFAAQVPKDKNGKKIDLKPGQVCAQITAVEQISCINKSLVKPNDDGMRAWAQNKEKKTVVLTPGLSGKDYIVVQGAVPNQPDNITCGPRALWVAACLESGVSFDAQSKAAVDAVIDYAYAYFDGEIRTLHGNELDNILRGDMNARIECLKAQQIKLSKSAPKEDSFKGKQAKKKFAFATKAYAQKVKNTNDALVLLENKKKECEEIKTTLDVLNASKQSSFTIVEGRDANSLLYEYLIEENDRVVDPINFEGVYYPKVQAFQGANGQPSIPQTIVLFVGGHWITVRLELEEIKEVTDAVESIKKSVKVTTYDGKGWNYSNNTTLKTLLYIFTQGTTYQIGDITTPEEYSWTEFEDLAVSKGVPEAWADEARAALTAEREAAEGEAAEFKEAMFKDMQPLEKDPLLKAPKPKK